MNTVEIRNILWSTPHRLNDEHVEYLLDYVEHLEFALKKSQEEYKKLSNTSLDHSKAMMGNMLGLMLNKPEMFHKEKNEELSTTEV